MRRTQIFVVAVEVDMRLESKVVSNFVEAAIKRYDRLLYRTNSMSYFDSYDIKPKYQVAEVDLSKKDDSMRDTVFMIKSIRDGDKDGLFSPILYPNNIWQGFKDTEND